MDREKVTKIARQYSAASISERDMEQLCRIAEDCRRVKNEVYQRYGGVRGLEKISQPYVIQNEMTATKLRNRLGLPAAYFYPAVFEAVADIKSRWAQERFVVAGKVRRHVDFTEEDKHLLYFVLRVEEAFSALMRGKMPMLRGRIQTRFEEIAAKADLRRTGSYLRRQMRSLHGRPRTDRADGFTVRTDGYRYRDHGIDLTSKERRKRIFIPLTDSNTYERQIYLRLRPKEFALEIHAPMDVRVKEHSDYQNAVGVAMGMRAMLVTDRGCIYGEKLWDYQERLSSWLREELSKFRKNGKANPGRKKYQAKKERLEQHLHSYINRELNRFLREEAPAAIYLLRMPSKRKHYGSSNVNDSLNMWQIGYIRRQLKLKCRENSVTLVEVTAKGITVQCSQCGAVGKREKGEFACESCGYRESEKINTARNIKHRGEEISLRCTKKQ